MNYYDLFASAFVHSWALVRSLWVSGRRVLVYNPLEFVTVTYQPLPHPPRYLHYCHKSALSTIIHNEWAEVVVAVWWTSKITM